MFFSLTYDDFQDYCFQDEFPLLRVINYHLNKANQIAYPDPDMQLYLSKSFKRNRLQAWLENFIKNLNSSETNTGKEIDF